MIQVDGRRLGVAVTVSVLALLIATILVGALRESTGASNASVVYVVAVVAAAVVAGMPGALAAALAAFLVYDFLFTEPYLTFTIRDPAEWIGLALMVFVGVVVSHLVALLRARAEEAVRREREARALFRLSHELANRDSTRTALPSIVRVLEAESRMRRVWVALGPDEGSEALAADSRPDEGPPPDGQASPVVVVLRRMPGEQPARWIRIHRTGARPSHRGSADDDLYRVRITAGAHLGSLWAFRRHAISAPDDTETRFFAAAADQVGQALVHDRLAAAASAAEIARQSDLLKSALLQSVSHDLRTPLATIRAAAGTLRPDVAMADADRLASAEAIDREVEYLDHLVTNLLDMSRIEAGALRADRAAFDLDDLVGPLRARLETRLAGRTLAVALDAPPVDVDPVFVSEALANVLENAVKYTWPGTAIRISAKPRGDDPGPAMVRLTVEDGGAGVPDTALDRLFEKFYRVPGTGRSSRSGTGIGLAVARGLIEATGGRIAARRSELGGLAVDIDLPRAVIPPEREDRPGPASLSVAKPPSGAPS